MEDNRKYSPSLMQKVKAEKEEEKRQEQLHKKYNIKNDDVKIKEIGFFSYFLAVLRILVFIVIAVLATCFIVILLYPDTRIAFFKSFKEDLPLSAVFALAVPVLYVLVYIVKIIIDKKKGSAPRRGDS